MKTGRLGEVDTQSRDGHDMTCLLKTTCLVKTLINTKLKVTELKQQNDLE